MKKSRWIYFFLVCLMLLSGCKHGNDTPSEKDTQSPIQISDEDIIGGDMTGDEDETPAQEISFEEGYNDSDRMIRFLGLKQYEKIEGEKITDTPDENNVFLVLFLRVENRSYEDNYIHPNYMESILDGTQNEHIALWNSPEEFEPLFGTVPYLSIKDGYIAWEVPKNWKSMDITFDFWKDYSGISLKMNLTSDMLTDLPDYY